MFSFHITEIRTIQISLAIIFIALGVIAALINFNFQVASDQRIQTLELTKAIHEADSRNDNQTEFLVNQTLNKIQRISDNQSNDTRTVIGLLLFNQDIIKENQKAIKNVTSTNLVNTFINKKNIQEILNLTKGEHLTDIGLDRTILHRLAEIINNTQYNNTSLSK